jgi:hypothetical protein
MIVARFPTSLRARKWIIVHVRPGARQEFLVCSLRQRSSNVYEELKCLARPRWGR